MGCIRKFGCPLMIGAVTTLALAAPAAADDDTAVTPAPVPVPHLSSPNNLPPDTVDQPPPAPGRIDYLRDLWHAVQSQEISGGNALLLLTQMPMNAPTPALPDMMQRQPAPGAQPPAPAIDPSA